MDAFKCASGLISCIQCSMADKRSIPLRIYEAGASMKDSGCLLEITKAALELLNNYQIK